MSALISGYIATTVSVGYMNIDDTTRELLQRYGFDREIFEQLRERLQKGLATDAHNRIEGDVQAPAVGDVRPLPPIGSDSRKALHEKGLEALRRGQVGAVILAGGMATRFGGVVKAAVEVVSGKSFLDLKLADIHRVAREAQAKVPVFVMTSFATDVDVTAMAQRASTHEVPVDTFAQFVSLRLTAEGQLFRGADGQVSPYAPGHGDLSFALRRAGILQRFRAAGGRVLYMSNVDNLTATLDPAVIGAHLETEAGVTAEVAPKEAGDKGGAPARVNGRPQIVESFRFPAEFNQDLIPVFNTNSFVLDAASIDKDFELTWFAVRKKVDGAEAIQFERLVGELTAYLPSTFLRVERHGLDARFQPVKDPEEMVVRRPEIVEVLTARGVI